MTVFEFAQNKLAGEIKKEVAEKFGVEPASLKFFKVKTEILQNDETALFEYHVTDNTVVRVEVS